MPIYVFACDDCGASTDVMRPMSAMNDSATCRSCGGANTKRELARFAIGGAAAGPTNDPESPVCGPARSNVTMNGCSFVNCGTAIKADGDVAIHGDRLISRGNGKTFDASGNAHIHFGAVDIS